MTGVSRIFKPPSAISRTNLAGGATATSPRSPRLSTTVAAPPPVVVMTATRATASPGGATTAGRAWRATNGAISNNVSRCCTRSTPCAFKKASTATSLPAMAPVWDCASASPCSDRPNLYATTGLPAAFARAKAQANVGAARSVSRNNRMTWVCRSSTSASTTSPTVISLSLPTDTDLAKPKPRAAARDSSEPIIDPLCDTRLRPPDSSVSASKAAFTERMPPLCRSARPMLLGPSRRSPSARAWRTNSAWRA